MNGGTYIGTQKSPYSTSENGLKPENVSVETVLPKTGGKMNTISSVKEIESQVYKESGNGPRPVEAQDSMEDQSFFPQRELEEIPHCDFYEDIKIDFIPAIDYRIMCRFLGISSINDLKNHPSISSTLISYMLMECIVPYMENCGYHFAGELNFNREGQSIPVGKVPWVINKREVIFSNSGFLYFESPTKQKKDNIVFFLYTNSCEGIAAITCFSTNTNHSRNMINDLEEYTKRHNCLRGAKLKDINIFSASFSQVNSDEKYSWNNYYYSKNVIDLFDLEVFNFVKNIEKYNENGITKRGVLMFSKPGCGKTSLGHIICNEIPDHTVIWITPELMAENNSGAYNSIKSLYKLADFVSPCIVILEDLDLFSQDRSSGGNLLSLGALMNVLDGVNSIKNAITIGTTNRLSSVEKALKNRPGRFDRIVEIPPLNDELREKMLSNRLKNWTLEKGIIKYIVNKTNDWTGAELQEFIYSLNLKQIGSKRNKKRVDKKWVNEILETMKQFGIGEKSSNFGFNKESNDD